MSRCAGVVAAAFAAILASFAAEPAARADTWSDIGSQRPNNPELDKRLYRSGVALGLSVGYGLAGTAGYPNSLSRIGDPAYYSSTDLLHGTSWSFAVMGALADYLNFGVWFGSGTFESAAWRSTGGGGGFRVEAFPLLVLVPSLKDVGVFAQLGLGDATAHYKAGGYPDAHGVQSFVGAGAFYEWTFAHALGGHTALGPSVEYDSIFAQTISRSSATLGLRVAFYGGQ
jgi:hypothetical protein